MIALLVGVCVPVAHAGTWTVGPNFGIEAFQSNGSGFAVFAAPTGGTSWSPGLRVGRLSKAEHSAWYLETTALYEKDENNSANNIMATINWQYGLHPERKSCLYGILGGGVQRDSFSSFFGRVTNSSQLLGFGLGLRRTVSEGHGAIRAELRYDELRDDSGSHAHLLSLRFGSDLWFK
ncbi:MAG: hypothetical protein ABL977_10845 [Candidatus Eisenbacteria bacterium]